MERFCKAISKIVQDHSSQDHAESKAISAEKINATGEFVRTGNLGTLGCV